MCQCFLESRNAIAEAVTQISILNGVRQQYEHGIIQRNDFFQRIQSGSLSIQSLCNADITQSCFIIPDFSCIV